MADGDERQEDPVLIALNALIREVQEIRAVLDGLAKRAAWGGDGEGSAPDDGSPGA
jgi:hypothetical protein